MLNTAQILVLYICFGALTLLTLFTDHFTAPTDRFFKRPEDHTTGSIFVRTLIEKRKRRKKLVPW